MVVLAVMENPVVTTKVNVLVLDAGAPAALAAIVTGNVPVGVAGVVLMVSEMVIGLDEVGFTELAGWKLQLAPPGRPEQERLTVPLNAPRAFTWKLTGEDVL